MWRLPLLLLLLLLLSARELPRVTVKARQARAGEATIEVVHRRNRFDALMIVYAYYDGFLYRSSTIELRGLASPPIHIFEWRSIPSGGILDVRVTLTDGEGKASGEATTRIFLRCYGEVCAS